MIFFFFFFDFSIEIQLDSFVVAVRQVNDIYRLLVRMDEGTKGESTRRNRGREGKGRKMKMAVLVNGRERD